MNPTTSSLPRRVFLKFAFAAPLFLSNKLFAETGCTPQGICTSQVDFADFAQEAFQQQRMPEWCWAACISMIFDFYGHPVAQERIVSEVYGAPVNMPAGYGITIAQQLNRTWRDDNGKRFRSTLTGAYDAQAGVDNLNNVTLISELDHNHPVLIGAAGHATVLTMMQYARTVMGPNVLACGVFDPWPGRGARNLTPPEMRPANLGGALSFVATARIRDIS